MPETRVNGEVFRRFPPARLALLKRVQKPGASIPFINKAVAVMNDNSIRGLLPVDGDDLLRAGQTLELRPAAGTERFTSLSDPDTRALVMNIDGIGEDAEARVVPVRGRVARMLGQYCGAEIETALFSPSQPSFGFSL